MPQESISGPISLAFPELTVPTKQAPAARPTTSFGDYLQRVAGESRNTPPASEPTPRAAAPAEPGTEVTAENTPNSASEQNAADNAGDAKTEEFTSSDSAGVREDEPADETQEQNTNDQDIEDGVEVSTAETDPVLRAAIAAALHLEQGQSTEQPADGKDKTSDERRQDIQRSHPESENGASKNGVPSDSRSGSQQALPSEVQSSKNAAVATQAAIQISEADVENDQAANSDEPPAESSQAKPADGADTPAGKAELQAAERVETTLASAGRESESAEATVRPEAAIVPVDGGGDDTKEGSTERQSLDQQERPLAASEQQPSDPSSSHAKTNPSVVDAVVAANVEAVTKDPEDVVTPERDIAKAQRTGADTGPPRGSSEITPFSDTQTQDGRTLASRSPANAPAEPQTASSAENIRFVQRVAGAFRAARDQGGEVRLRLSPPELGSLRVELTVKNGVLTARLEAETQAARTTLLDNLPMLRDRLAGQDIKIDRFDVDVREESSGRSRERASEDGHREPRENRNPTHSENEDQSAGARQNIPSSGRITAGANDGQLNVVV